MTAIDWTDLCKKYKNLWVALADDEITVLGSGKKLPEVIAQAKRKGVTCPILMRVPELNKTYIPTAWIIE